MPSPSFQSSCSWRASRCRDPLGHVESAAIILHVIAWGGILKGAVLILRPKVLLAQAQHFGRPGFLHGVWIVCTVLGVYFTWFGYFRVA